MRYIDWAAAAFQTAPDARGVYACFQECADLLLDEEALFAAAGHYRCVCIFFSFRTSFVFEGLGFGWLVGGPKCFVAFVMRAELPNPS
jgi:hypothetical protein